MEKFTERLKSNPEALGKFYGIIESELNVVEKFEAIELLENNMKTPEPKPFVGNYKPRGLADFTVHNTLNRSYVWLDGFFIGSCGIDPTNNYPMFEAVIEHWELTGESGFIL